MKQWINIKLPWAMKLQTYPFALNLSMTAAKIIA